MFDSKLILMDGSVVTTSAHTPATSTTRSATTGAAVIDLGAGGTPAGGLTGVLICPDDLVAGADAYTLTAYLQASDTEDMSAATDIERLGSFGVANATTGVILGSETPCVATVRFATKKRYIRVNLAVNFDFGYIKVYIEPYTFKKL